MQNEIKVKIKTVRYDKSFVNKINVKTHYVTDGIQDDFKHWAPYSPVLISAQTGRGKNHFIENQILSFVVERDLRLLILSNRIAVSIQQKKRIASKTGCLNYFEKYTVKGFEQETEYGPVTIMTYQGFWEKFVAAKGALFTKYDYVVLDEAHYFISDSKFNSKTGLLLNRIPIIFAKSVRVYLTATEEEFLPELVNVEQQTTTLYQTNLIHSDLFYFHPPELLLYEFKRDFSYICPFYFNEMQEILQLINTDPGTEKWIIFVKSIEAGNSLLSSLPNVSKFINASNRNSSDNIDTWTSLTERECFDCKVLITTSVLDNGININDDKLKNVVIFSQDKTEFLQMLGRKRINGKEKVNVYIHVPTKRSISSDLTQSIEAQRLFRLSIKNYPAFLEKHVLPGDNRIQQYFYIDDDLVLRPNNLAQVKTNYQISQLTRWKDSDSTSIIKEKLQWINQKYDPAKWLNRKDLRKEKLFELLAEVCDKSLNAKQFTEFSHVFKRLINEVYGKHPNDRSDRKEWNTTTVRNRLEFYHLGYTLKLTQGTIYIIKSDQIEEERIGR